MVVGTAQGWEVEFVVSSDSLGPGIHAVAFRDWDHMRATIVYCDAVRAAELRAATKAIAARLNEPGAFPIIHRDPFAKKGTK